MTSITTSPRGFEGEGFPVRRAFAGVDLADVDPFVHLDQMGEVEYAPGEPKGTPWHPHRGFETVTYMMDGAFEHSDSNGGGGTITNGDTQWMTAGAGILHIEKPPRPWSPAAGSSTASSCGSTCRVPRSSPRRATRTCAPGKSPCWPRPTGAPWCASSPATWPVTPESRSPNLDVLLLGGRPIREPVAWMGPFVMNTREEVLQAFADYKAGRLGSIPAVHGTPTALIESRSQPAERPGV